MNDIKILDLGHVRMVESTLSDISVVRSARVSYGKGVTEPEKDKKLIRYMLDNKHHTPFEHNTVTFHVKCPIFVMRQIIRTRIGVSFNEISGRYTEMKDDFYLPAVWRAQDTKNKQGSVEAATLPHAEMTAEVEAFHRSTYALYESLIARGAAREMARIVLPLSLYTEFYFTLNARSLMNFIVLRSDGHAQAETRQFSHAMAYFLSEAMPWTWEGFTGTLRGNYDEMAAAIFRFKAQEQQIVGGCVPQMV